MACGTLFFCRNWNLGSVCDVCGAADACDTPDARLLSGFVVEWVNVRMGLFC